MIFPQSWSRWARLKFRVLVFLGLEDPGWPATIARLEKRIEEVKAMFP